MGKNIKEEIKNALILSGTRFTPDKIEAYEDAIKLEKNPNAKWALETMLENSKIAEKERIPLCDDTGIPHIFIEIGENRALTGKKILDIKEGVRDGLISMPGRPMAIKGNDLERIDQSGGLDKNPGAVLPAPIIIKDIDEKDMLRVHILLYGGGPAIRGKTQRIFHKHDSKIVIEEIIEWAKEGVSKLGCTPCTLAIGIGRSQFEATALMTEAQIYGKYNVQSSLEKEITYKVNESEVGPINLGGNNSVLATFLKVGPQRASGIRVVSLRPNCCVEPRIASVEL